MRTPKVAKRIPADGKTTITARVPASTYAFIEELQQKVGLMVSELVDMDAVPTKDKIVCSLLKKGIAAEQADPNSILNSIKVAPRPEMDR